MNNNWTVMGFEQERVALQKGATLKGGLAIALRKRRNHKRLIPSILDGEAMYR